MKVCVFGANAFSGQDFVDLLLDDPAYEIIGISRSPERSGLSLRYKTRPGLSRYRYYQRDVNRDMSAVLELLDAERPDAIVNFAAQSEVGPSWEHPEHWYQTNCVALATLVNHLRKQDYLERFLHVSTNEVYGTCRGTVKEDAPLNPSTPYAASKAAADVLLKIYNEQFGFPLLVVRSTNVYGARQQLFKIVPRTAIYLKLGQRVELHGGGTAVKSYIHIRDVSAGEKAILERGRIGEIYHLSPDTAIEVRDVVRTICERAGRRFEESVVTVGERPGQDAAYFIDSSKARTELGWRPQVSLQHGLTEVLQWVDQYWAEIRKQPLAYEHRA